MSDQDCVAACSRRAVILSTALIAAVLCQTAPALAGDLLRGIRPSWFDEAPAEACEETEEPRPSYGPCACQSRGTLFQWSYGTSFTGGPNLDEPIVTDRPDFTEASSTVGKGVLQVEAGYTYNFDNDGTDQTIGHSYPETLFRYGVLADWLELRLAHNFASESLNGATSSGAEDLYLGLKIGLTPQEGWLPEMALIPQMTVPTGTSALSADRVLPGVNWLYGWDVTDFISTAGSTQFNSTIDDGSGNVYTEWSQSWTVGYSLHDRIGAYTEVFGHFPHGADTSVAEHYFDGGFTFLVNDNIQWDIRAGVGLNDAADDYFVGSGASFRFQ